MAQAVFRINKIKTFGGLAGALSHAYRTRPTPNADMSRRNIIIKGCDPDNFRPAWDDIAQGAKITTSGSHSSVIAVDVLITASPEFFRPDDPDRAGYWDEKRLNAWRAVMEPEIEKAFPNALNVMLHLDEATPHYTIIDVPLTQTKTGKPRLSCKAKYGSDDSRSEGLSKWQDWAGEVMSPLGIERGTPRSQAVHVPPKSFNNELNRALNEPAPPVPKPTKKKPKPLPDKTIKEEMAFTKAFDQRMEAEKKYREELAAFNADSKRVAQDTESLVKLSHAKAQSVDRIKKRLDEQTRTTKVIGAERDELKKVADQLRQLPIAEVIERVYGAELAKDSSKKHKTLKYKLNGESVMITPSHPNDLFLFQSDGKGGKGAINFVMEASGVDYKGALAILSEHFDSNALTAEVLQSQREAARKKVEEAKSSPPPIPAAVPSRLPDVVEYLTHARGLPMRLVEAAIRIGKLFADRFGNAVFPRSGGGAFLRGTHGEFKQTLGGKDCGGYVIDGRSGGGAYYVESAITALSVKAANPDAWVCAVGGDMGGFSPSAMASPPAGEKVYLAFDNDEKGEKFAGVYAAAYPHGERITPVGNDWNDDIRNGDLPIDARWTGGSDGGARAVVAPKLG